MKTCFKPLQSHFCSKAKYFKDNSLIIADDRLQSLHKLTGIFARHKVNMRFVKTHLQDFRPDLKKQYTLSISIEKICDQKQNSLVNQLKTIGCHTIVQGPIEVPWFPTQEADVDHLGKTLLDVKDQVNRDHLQFSDVEYRKRRDLIIQNSFQYKFGQKIKPVQYNQQETQLWCRIYKKLRQLHRTCMSQKFQYQIEKMNGYFNLEDKIPQLNQLSLYLQSQTGFKIKPVHGILSQRQFLNSFAFKIFPSTQYLRNTKTPDYTPQPDIVHQIIGHIPLFADKEVAELSHKIGLISLGASDIQIAKLGTLYWYTLQFGVCNQNGLKKGYGAGIASSISEIQHFTSQKAKFKNFEPLQDCNTSYPIQSVQECYRVTQSFKKSLQAMQQYGKNILKPISTTYDFVTKSIMYDRNIEGICRTQIHPYQ